jgi:hypothetical protein
MSQHKEQYMKTVVFEFAITGEDTIVEEAKEAAREMLTDGQLQVGPSDRENETLQSITVKVIEDIAAGITGGTTVYHAQRKEDGTYDVAE